MGLAYTIFPVPAGTIRRFRGGWKDYDKTVTSLVPDKERCQGTIL